MPFQQWNLNILLDNHFTTISPDMSKNHFLQTDKWIRQKQKRKKVWRGQKERMKSLMFQRCAAFSKFDLMSYVVKRLGIHYIRNSMKWGNFSKRGVDNWQHFRLGEQKQFDHCVKWYILANKFLLCSRKAFTFSKEKFALILNERWARAQP